jgi:hypothetical protein
LAPAYLHLTYPVHTAWGNTLQYPRAHRTLHGAQPNDNDNPCKQDRVHPTYRQDEVNQEPRTGLVPLAPVSQPRRNQRAHVRAFTSAPNCLHQACQARRGMTAMCTNMDVAINRLRVCSDGVGSGMDTLRALHYFVLCTAHRMLCMECMRSLWMQARMHVFTLVHTAEV